MENNYVDCSHYKGHIRHSNGFSTFEHEGEFYFAYIDENGNVILRSEGYKTEASRNNGIESVMKNMDSDNRYKTIQQEDGKWALSLKAGNNQEIALSCPVDSEEAARHFLPSERARLRAEAMKMLSLSSDSKIITTPVTNNADDNYLVCSEYQERIQDSVSATHTDFIEFQHSNGQYYFAWIVDGNVSMRSEGYPSTAARDNGLQSVISNRNNESRYKTEEAHGAHFLVLKAGNGQEIARSCPKKTADEVNSSIGLLAGLGLATAGTVTLASKMDSPVLDAFKSETPVVDIPEVEVVAPEIIVPAVEIPKIETPTVDIPVVETPKIETPKINPSTKFTIDNTNAFVEEKSKWRWLWWLLGLIALLGLFWMLYQKGCGAPKPVDAATAMADSIEFNNAIAIDTNMLLDDLGLEAKSTWDSLLGEMTEIILPNGDKIMVPVNGAEKKLVDFLNGGCNGELKKTWFNMDRILFNSGSTTLNSVSHEQLNVLNKIFAAYPDTYFKIGGYTDNVGDSILNVKLSGARALSVERAIQAKGMQDKRIRSEGYGPDHFICKENNTPECRAINRRVSIRVDTCNVSVRR